MLKPIWENKMVKAKLTNKSNVPLHGLNPGESTKIDYDEKLGVPKEQHWRRRAKDAAVDGCVDIEIIKPKKTKKEDS